MKRILVTGGHSHVCRAVSETLVSCYSVLEVPSDSHALGAASLDRIRQSEADILVYAGGGALSSWDLQVGRTTEKNSLVALADLADINRELNKRLWLPLSNHIPDGTKKLILCPDSALWQVPWAAACFVASW